MHDFTLTEAMAAQRALRVAAGLPEETFPTDRLVGMVSDEIEALRENGVTDDEIVAIISDATGKSISGAELEEHYVPSDRRHGSHD